MRDETLLEDYPIIASTRDDRDDRDPGLPDPGASQPPAFAGPAPGTSAATTLDAFPDARADAAPDAIKDPVEHPGTTERPPEARIVAVLHGRGKHAASSPPATWRARRLADDGGEPLLRMLVRLGLVSERDMAQAASQVLGLPLADLSQFPSAPVAEGVFSLCFLKDTRVLPGRRIPVRRRGGRRGPLYAGRGRHDGG